MTSTSHTSNTGPPAATERIRNQRGAQPQPARAAPVVRRPRATAARVRRRGARGTPVARIALLRLRVGFVVIAMVLSFFGARLVQLQGIDPEAYAAMAARRGHRQVVLPAERGEILDRNGVPLADSVDGLMVVADPLHDARRRAGARDVPARRLHVDYFPTLDALRRRRQPLRVHRPAGAADRWPTGSSTRPRDAGLQGPRHPPRPDARLPGRRRRGQPGRLHRAPTSRWPASSAPSTSSSPAPTARRPTRSAAATASRSATAP